MMLAGLTANASRFLFFTGKGGVGKTSTATASAVALADRGARVLLVSTDPASNLDEVLATELGTTPTPVNGVPRLAAMNIDPLAAAAAYRERVVSPYRTALPASAIANIEEQLSGACTVEIAAFDEFTTLLADPTVTAGYDHILFDTAPTGHTLRLLSLPQAWSTFVDTNTLGTSCIGPLSGLANQQSRYLEAVAVLSDPTKTSLVLVARPDPLSFAEAAHASKELQALGMGNQRLVVNGLFTSTDSGDPLARTLAAKAASALKSLPKSLGDLPRDEVRLVPWSLVGISGLRSLLADTSPDEALPSQTSIAATGELRDIVGELVKRGQGLVLTMGKGGVGKTTIAAAIACELARQGCDVELTTTDPAAHLEAVLVGEGVSIASRLHVSRIDPEVVTAAYTSEVLATVGADLDDRGRAVLQEDLRSPCTEEIAVFGAFARTVGEAVDRFVVLDTAPTGHTVLLLDAARAYHREVGRQGGGVPPAVASLMDRLTDPTYTSVFIVTLPEATPVHEAAALQADLRRAGIEPAGWVVNQSLTAAHVTDSLLAIRARAEMHVINEIASRYADNPVLVAMSGEAPTGLDGLAKLLEAPVPVGAQR